MFTHLGNGCPMRMHRHENVIQRALSLADRLWISFIADGAHVPFYALGNYLRRTGVDRAVVVTDATAAAGLPPGRVRLGRWDVEIGEDRVARSPDGTHLIGSAITMRESRRRLADHLDLTAEQIDSLTCRNPREAVRL